MARLAEADWPQLQQPDLSYNSMDSKAIAKLVEADWSMLDTLNLSYNVLKTKGVACLVNANWPCKVCGSAV